MDTTMNLNNADPIELLLHVQDNFGLVRPSSKYDESFGHHFPKGTPVITRVVLNEGGVVRTVYDAAIAKHRSQHGNPTGNPSHVWTFYVGDRRRPHLRAWVTASNSSTGAKVRGTLYEFTRSSWRKRHGIPAYIGEEARELWQSLDANTQAWIVEGRTGLLPEQRGAAEKTPRRRNTHLTVGEKVKLSDNALGVFRDTDGARDDDGVIRTVYETDTLQQAAEAIKRLRREWSRRGCCLHPDYIPPPVLRVRGGVWCLSEGNPITFIPWKDIHPDVRDEQSPWYIEGLKRDAWLDHGETGNEG